MANVSIEPISEVDVTMGPIRVFSTREVHWKIRAGRDGYHQITFSLDDRKVSKELAIGNGFMRVSAVRPGWNWTDILLYPWEKPFHPDAIVQSISIEYPERISKTSGTDWWIVYFFLVSLVFALIFKPGLKVRI
jgi:hypothetical protein